MTLGERINYSESFANMYLEEDAFNPKGNFWYTEQIKITEERDKLQLYKKNPNFNYEFIEPSENSLNKIARAIYVRLIQLRLFLLQIPILFNFVKTLLFYLLIFNKLLLVTYIISLIIILSRIIFHITDFNMHKITKSYLLLIDLGFSTGNKDHLHLVFPNKKNALTLFMWLTRGLNVDARIECYEKFDKYIITGSYDSQTYIYDRLINLNYIKKDQNYTCYTYLDLKPINKLYKILVLTFFFIIFIFTFKTYLLYYSISYFDIDEIKDMGGLFGALFTNRGNTFKSYYK